MSHTAKRAPSPPWPGISCQACVSPAEAGQRHCHGEYELCFVVSGVYTLELDKESLRLSEGQVVLLRPEETHAWRAESRGRCLSLSFPRAEMERALAFLGEERLMRLSGEERPPLIRLHAAALNQSAQRFERIRRLCHTEPAQALLELRVLLAELVLQYLALYQAPPPAHAPWLARLLHEMQKPENIRSGLPAMLVHSPYSHAYLCREFKRLMGLKPTEYVNGLRLDLAHSLLKSSGRSIADICYDVGFGSVGYFYRLYGARFGSTPHLSRTKPSNA